MLGSSWIGGSGWKLSSLIGLPNSYIAVKRNETIRPFSYHGKAFQSRGESKIIRPKDRD